MRKFIILAVSVAICGLLYVSASFATTYYVAPGASGSGTSNDPMNIVTAFANAQAGDVVNIKGGKYTNVHPVVGHSGTSESARITFQAWEGTGKPILIGEQHKARYSGTEEGKNYGIIAKGKSYITLKGIRVTKYCYGIYFNNSGSNANGCHYAIIDGCEADSSNVGVGSDGYGIMIQDGDHCIIRNCTTVDNDGDNIFLSRSRHTVVENCTVKSKQTSDNGYITDYYLVMAWCSYDTVRGCYAEDVNGSYKGNHAFIIKDTPLTQSQGDETHSTGNLIVSCTAKKFEEGFVISHQAFNNTVDSCYIDNTGKNSAFNFCFQIREAAYNNTIKNSTGIAKAGYGVVSVYDGTEAGTSQYQTGNRFVNCTFNGGGTGGMAIYFRNAVNTTFQNCTIVNCTSLFRFSWNRTGANWTSGTVLKNCILSGVTNTYESKTRGKDIDNLAFSYNLTTEAGHNYVSGVSFLYNDLYNGFEPSAVSGNGNFDANPLFASTTDFHVKSNHGWWNGSTWVADADSSPCIDAGTPYLASDSSTYYFNEPEGNGGRINVGRYGNTSEASKSGGTVNPPEPTDSLYTVTKSPDTTGDYVCNGTNDTAQINAALSAARADGARHPIVHLTGPATYNITATLGIGSNTELRGDSTAVLKLTAATITNVIATDSGASGIKIHGFKIDGNSVGTLASTPYVLSLVGAVSNAEIYDMYIYNSMSGAVTAPGSPTNLSIHNNRFINTGNSAVLVTGGSNFTAYGNTIQTRQTYGIGMTNTQAVKIYNNTLYSNGETTVSRAIDYNRNADVVVSAEIYGNRISDYYGAGIWLYNKSTTAYAPSNAYANIHHNTIINCGSTPVVKAGAIRSNGFNLLVQNNVMDSCRYGGYETCFYSGVKETNSSAASVYVQNNIITNCDSIGIFAKKVNAKENVILRNNCFYNCATNWNADSISSALNNLVNTNPLFASATDYHLRSQEGRWNGTQWVKDSSTSPCIDAGVDTCACVNEPAPNGSLINLGVYGNTTQASKSYSASQYVDSLYVVTKSPDTTGDYVCNGTNDTAQINAALAAAYADSARNPIVYIKAGTYSITGTLTIGGKTELKGDSTTVLDFTATTIASVIQTNSGASNIKIHGITIDGNNVGSLGSTAYVVSLVGAVSNVQIYDMYVHDTMSGAVTAPGSPTNLSIRNNRFINMGNSAVSVTGGSNLIVYANTIQTRKNYGIGMTNTQTLKVYSNTLYSNGETTVSRAIDYNRNADVVVSAEIYRNKISDFYGAGVWFYNKSTTAYAPSNAYANIHHNIIINCGSTPVVKAGAIRSNGFNLLVQNNVMDSCRYGGYETCFYSGVKETNSSATSVYVQNNIITNCDSIGIFAKKVNAKENVILRNNCFYNCAANWNADSISSASNNLVNTNPLFASATDYHLKSRGGRYSGGTWIIDTQHSPCVDAGVDTCVYANEPAPNGSRINIGRYGNTTQASKSYTHPAHTFIVTKSPDASGDYICDGTNDQVEINAALTAAYADSANSPVVYLTGPATYNVDSTLFIYPKTKLTGDSTAVVKVINSANWATGVPIIKTKVTGSRNIEICGFEIDGNSANNTGAVNTGYYRAVYLDAGINYVRIHDMYIHDTRDAAVYAPSSGSPDSIFVYDNQFLNLNGYGVYVFNKATNVRVYNNTIETACACPVMLVDANAVKIYNNQLMMHDETTGAQGILMKRQTAGATMNDIEINNNTISHTYGPGIWFMNTNSTAYTCNQTFGNIHHNTLIGCGVGVAVPSIRSNGFSLLIQNNVIDSCKYGGYEVLIYSSVKDPQDSSVIKMQNNIFANCTSDTAVVHRQFGGKERMYLKNNCFFNCLKTYNADSVNFAGNNIGQDPRFADAANHDYHLKSTVGRWNGSTWVTDTVHSPCIDAGVDTCYFGNEPENNGNKINIGLYGNTIYASKSSLGYKIASISEVPTSFSLGDNVPNPFNPATTISYTVASERLVTLKVYSASGQLVSTLVNDVKTPGTYYVTWKPVGLASGMYFCRLQAGSFTKTTKMIFMK